MDAALLEIKVCIIMELFDMELLIIHVVDLAQPSKDVFLHFMLVMEMLLQNVTLWPIIHILEFWEKDLFNLA